MSLLLKARIRCCVKAVIHDVQYKRQVQCSEYKNIVLCLYIATGIILSALLSLHVNSSEKNKFMTTKDSLKCWKACCCGNSTLVTLPSSHHDVTSHPPVGAPAAESRATIRACSMHTCGGSSIH